MLKRISVIASLVLAMTLSASMALAADGDKKGPRDKKKRPGADQARRGDRKPAVELTDDQKAGLKKINDDCKAAMKEAGENREKKMEAMKARRAATEELLGKELMAKLRAGRGGRGGPGHTPFEGIKNLTKEQQVKLKAIGETFTKAMKAAGEDRKAKGEAMKARKAAVEEVLTEEQLKQLRENMAKRGGDRKRPAGKPGEGKGGKGGKRGEK